MKKTKNNGKVVFTTIVLILIALAGLVFVFLLNYNTYSPDKPELLEDGENVYISTSINTNYQGYRFKFVDESKQVVIIDSQYNLLSVQEVMDKGIELGKSYKISTCYIGKNQVNNSDYSEEIDWPCQLYLTPTIINYDEGANKLTWIAVENADFYRVFYNDNSGDYYETAELNVDLTSFDVGEKVMYVVAYSNNNFYEESGKSNIIEFNLKHFYSAFDSISFDKDSKILTAENKEMLEKVEIYLSDKQFINIKFDVKKNQGKYIYKIDLTAVYNGEKTIGIAPANIDEFHVYTGEVKTFEIPD